LSKITANDRDDDDDDPVTNNLSGSENIIAVLQEGAQEGR